MSRQGILWAGKRLLIAASLLVCAASAQMQVPTVPDGAAAVVIELIGRVDVMRDTTPWALNVGDAIRPRQLLLTGPDGYAAFRLADGSTFEIYSNARVTFRDTPGDWKDLLEVWLGRIRVHIQKLGGEPNQNRVRTPTAVISVRGTIFDVSVEDDGDVTAVSVEEGLVDVDHRLLRTGKPVPLRPGESIRVYKNQPLTAKLIDKGSMAKAVARTLSEGLTQILLGRQRVGGGGGASPVPSTGGAGGGVGDERAPEAPTTAPPAPPPAN
ncbi:MAG: FecR family protein [Bryobacteraceae bacterium]